jgi:Fe-S-cluster-containing hydrogenase component 2
LREVLIRDLGKCINCNVCVEACQTRHGRARMTMTGPVFGQYQLPDVCRNCPDTPCVRACHLDGMHRHDGKTFVSDACRGCNKCVEACPYGVIVLLPRQHQQREGFFKRIVAQARGFGRGQSGGFIDGHVAADATRCVQCGVCGYNCPAGIQVRDYAREGKIVDDERCVKCGLCIEKCPRGTLRWDTVQTLPVAPTPLFRADKCDLCRGYGESACVKECPTGAMLRLPATEQLQALNDQLYAAVMERANLPPAKQSAWHTSPIDLYDEPLTPASDRAARPNNQRPAGQTGSLRGKVAAAK